MRALLLRRHAACALAAACVLPPPRSGAADYATTEEAAARQVEAELQQTARFFREPPIFPLLSAQRSLEALLADEATFRELACLGLPTGAQQVPVVLLPEYLERLGDVASDRAAWAAAAREYVRDARDADELISFATAAARGLQPDRAAEYVDRAVAASRRAGDELRTLVRLLPRDPQNPAKLLPRVAAGTGKRFDAGLCIRVRCD